MQCPTNRPEIAIFPVTWEDGTWPLLVSARVFLEKNPGTRGKNAGKKSVGEF